MRGLFHATDTEECCKNLESSIAGSFSVIHLTPRGLPPEARGDLEGLRDRVRATFMGMKPFRFDIDSTGTPLSRTLTVSDSMMRLDIAALGEGRRSPMLLSEETEHAIMSLVDTAVTVATRELFGVDTLDARRILQFRSDQSMSAAQSLEARLALINAIPELPVESRLAAFHGMLQECIKCYGRPVNVTGGDPESPELRSAINALCLHIECLPYTERAAEWKKIVNLSMVHYRERSMPFTRIALILISGMHIDHAQIEREDAEIWNRIFAAARDTTRADLIHAILQHVQLMDKPSERLAHLVGVAYRLQCLPAITRWEALRCLEAGAQSLPKEERQEFYHVTSAYLREAQAEDEEQRKINYRDDAFVVGF